MDVALWVHLPTINRTSEEPLHHQHLMQREASKFEPERDMWPPQEAIFPC